MRRRQWRRATGILLAGVLVLTGCGDDDDEETSSATTAEEAGGEAGEFCRAALLAETVLSQGPDIGEDTPEDVRKKELESFAARAEPRLAKAEETAPDEVRPDVDVVAAGFRKGFETGDDPFEDEAMVDALARVGAWEKDNCGWDVTEVEATEYAFAGIPEELKAGVVGFELSNDGKEVHELIVFRKKDGVTDSAEDILALGEEGADAKMEFVMAAFAEPGDKGYAYRTIEAGDYFGVCFVPVGMTPEKIRAAEESGEEPEGPPHFTEGMVTEFTVA